VSPRLKELEGIVASDGQPAPRPRPGRRLTRVGAAGLAAGLLGSVVLYVVLQAAEGDGSSTASGKPPTGTATVTRQDLVSRTEVDGTLGYAGHVSVVGQIQGTVTSVPAVGTVIERGQSLYSVDNRPVPLLYGDVPAWRAMSEGTTGPDVRQLEENLVALGYATESELTVDDRYTSATAAAVRRWQNALGVDQTGVVELGQAVFLPGAVRVSEIKAEKGSATAPGSPVLGATTTSRVVKIDLDAAKQSLVKVGDTVEVKLPGGRTTTGVISSVAGAVETRGQGEDARQVIPVTVTLHDPAAAGNLDQAPVRVGITSESRKGVLTVPVNALLALAEGGYGVRVLDGSPSGRIVPVTTGLFARGLVEVSGDGLQEGMKVEVPAS
jgi:peptidoglycan hydrolase-like protein with peptidoglycan-binding domain